MGTAVTLAIGGNGSNIAYLSHSAGTAHGAPPLARPLPPCVSVARGGWVAVLNGKGLRNPSDPQALP